MGSNTLAKSFKLLALGLFITFVTAFTLSALPSVSNLFLENRFLVIGLVIAEVVAAISLSVGIRKMSASTLKILYFLYSLLTGISFTAIFQYYDLSNVILVFAATALLFISFAYFAEKTNLDLTKFGPYLLVGLLGMVLMAVINILFLRSDSFSLLISVLGVLVFVLYIGYDVQNVLRLERENSIPEENLAIFGAFSLYLDFINLFVKLLRLIAKKKD